jgi:hypothetical protein
MLVILSNADDSFGFYGDLTVPGPAALAPEQGRHHAR